MRQTSIPAERRVPEITKVEGKLAGPRFVTNLATVLTGQAVSAALALGVEVCYARLIGPEGRGQINLCLMTIAVGAVVAGLGGEIPITTWTANKKQRLSEWLPAVLFFGLLGTCAAWFLWTATYWIWHPAFLRGISDFLAVLIMVGIPISVFMTYVVALFTGMERFRERATLFAVKKLFEFICILLFILCLAKTAEAALLGNLASMLLTATAAGYVLREQFRGWWKIDAARKHIRRALSLGFRGQFGNLAMFVSYRLDVFVVNYFLDPAQVGLYALGVVISESLWQIPQAVAVTLFPRTARTLEEGAEQFTCFVARQVLFLATGLGLILAAASPWIVPLVFGHRFDASVAVIWWILPGTVALSLAKVMSADITARGRPEYNSYASVAGGIVTIMLDLLLIPRMGIRGAALASSIVYLLQSIFIALVLKSQLGVPWHSLVVPTRAELAAYSNLWQALKSRLGY